ncbi:MAG TPA: thioredoxin family protein [Chitinophagaceae bacterium]|jgi:thiol:disulfide interchange protein DsbD|nr:thioredoxin family protein [Chitinophagaceae bacterium]HMU57399.1 thioredoxin family protein [Chitinophagaceae bacterium]
MFRKLNYLSVFLLSVLLSANLFSQEEILTLKGWNVVSKKTGSNKYDLTFTVSSFQGWQLYAPNQIIADLKTTELSFADSSIRQEGDFVLHNQPQKIKSPIFDGQEVAIFSEKASWTATIVINGAIPAKLGGNLLYTFGKADEFYPGTVYPFEVNLEGGVQASTEVKVASIDITKPVSNCGDEGTENKSLVTIFLLGLLGGLIALLTPCVFPMIPVTVTFFTKKSTDRKSGITNAVLYGLFIFLIYVLITLPFHVAGKAISPEIFNNISTNVWLNLLFFIIFVVFALSFFGLFEIGLPAGLANKMDSKSGLGNIGGIFFMAGTLAIVSFSCTGPILGTLLVGVADQGAWPLTIGAAGFGIALGLPFALFAMFPHWLQSLPKSGGWMTDVKVVLGFLELALAVKFLSNADLVKQWGLLKREIFIGLWVIIGVLIVLYLAGKLRFAHSSPVKKFSFARISLIVLFTAITIYLIPGLTNSKAADLKIISGFPPPRTYSLYDVEKGKTGVFDPIHNDYEKALQLAKEQNKPVLIDFTGWACVNCRRMEEKVWPDKTVDSLMRNEFVVVSLYVDEKNNLPLTEQTTVTLSNGTRKSIVTVGDKWSTFQIENFGATSQPQYAILNSDQVALTKTKFYTPSASEFVKWLECGLEAFRKSKQEIIK